MERSNLDEIFSAVGLDYSDKVVKKMDGPGDGGSETPPRASEARRTPPLLVVDIVSYFLWISRLFCEVATEIMEINNR